MPTPDWLLDEKRDPPLAHLRAVLREHLADRLADTLAERLNIAWRTGQCAGQDPARAQSNDFPLGASAPTAPKALPRPRSLWAASTHGELSSKTMEARKVPGLYAIGEAVDVTGWLGGYNFQWAWASAHAAGQNL